MMVISKYNNYIFYNMMITNVANICFYWIHIGAFFGAVDRDRHQPLPHNPKGVPEGHIGVRCLAQGHISQACLVCNLSRQHFSHKPVFQARYGSPLLYIYKQIQNKLEHLPFPATIKYDSWDDFLNIHWEDGVEGNAWFKRSVCWGFLNILPVSVWFSSKTCRLS